MIKKLSSLLALLAVIAILALALAGPLYQAQTLGLREAFTVLRYAAIGGGIIAIIGLLILLYSVTLGRQANLGKGAPVLAIVLGAITFILPYQQYATATSPNIPRIHDISTDTENPPEFVAVAPLRADAPNPVEYAGAETAALQLQHYPDITTYETSASVTEIVAAAEQVATAMGWEIVASVPAAGRFEATDTTFWFGFKDDVVLRAITEDGMTRVDVRSKSRVGMSDVGVNAQRIRAFIVSLDEALKS
ncbi:DUF1499 domain-containing protein [Pseudidiomarina taiwanensis]|uniref:DUF1499 domain-containing protein n=1 Tax=Pseudidiomarina taiwanensis TaxID=337250 RepID=A0A432ZN46_9GAMM|nr:DUF1499 domain-containing protein [Pseudidiomarina taiwanensis]RUO79288.1 DUF1499 domain-containing protein [Pseudidiomarina taiwanensis]